MGPSSPCRRTRCLRDWMSLIAVSLGVGSMVVMMVFLFSEVALGGVLETLVSTSKGLDGEDERGQELDERLRETREARLQMEEIISDLVNHACDLHEAVGRFGALYPPGILPKLKYPPSPPATEEQALVTHLFVRIGKELESQPDVCAEVLARLQRERSIRDSNDASPVAPHP